MVSVPITNSQISSIKKLAVMIKKMKDILEGLPEEQQKLLVLRTFTLLVEDIDPEFSLYMTQILEGGLN